MEHTQVRRKTLEVDSYGDDDDDEELDCPLA